MVSDQIKKGADRAPHRSLLYALGLTEEEIARPLIAVVSAKSDIIPGHIHLGKIAEAVKAGIYAAGGTPVVVPAIGVCDGIVMGHKGMHYSLASRELIADSVETLLTAHCFDGAVLIPNCDKIVPGMLMGAIRVNIPALVCSGGPMLAGHVNGKKTSLSQMFEAVGAYQAGKLDDASLRKCEQSSCPSCGSCSGMFTANSMNCLCEALGMALPGNGSIPAPCSARIQFSKHSGMKVMELVEKNIRPRDIVTAEAFHNAITVDMALGCSTNTSLHIPAIAHEAGLTIDLKQFNEISEKTPNLCHLAPAGEHFMEELDEAGGVSAVMKELADKGLLHTELPTVTGHTVGENIAHADNRDPEVIRPLDKPYSATGGLAFLFGNNPSFMLMDGAYVNDAAIIAQNNKMISINSCVEIDFYGQAASESVGRLQISGTGGQTDFVRGATRSPGGKSLIVLQSTAQGGKRSKIVPFLGEGTPVTLPRTDIDYVVTEYGVAALRGKCIRERAQELIHIAHPNFREELIEAWEKFFCQKFPREVLN